MGVPTLLFKVIMKNMSHKIYLCILGLRLALCQY